MPGFEDGRQRPRHGAAQTIEPLFAVTSADPAQSSNRYSCSCSGKRTNSLAAPVSMCAMPARGTSYPARRGRPFASAAMAARSSELTRLASRMTTATSGSRTTTTVSFPSLRANRFARDSR